MFFVSSTLRFFQCHFLKKHISLSLLFSKSRYTGVSRNFLIVLCEILRYTMQYTIDDLFPQMQKIEAVLPLPFFSSQKKEVSSSFNTYQLFHRRETFQFKFNFGSDLLKIPRFWDTNLCLPLRSMKQKSKRKMRPSSVQQPLLYSA